MEDTSTSDSASPDVRPVICESLLDLSDWQDLLECGDSDDEGETGDTPPHPKAAPHDKGGTVSGDEGGKSGGLGSQSQPKTQSKGPAATMRKDHQQGALSVGASPDLPDQSSRVEQSIAQNVFKSNGTAVRSKRKLHPSWPEVSVKLGQDVTYNSFPHEHFSFAFKDVPFEKKKKRQVYDEEDDDDLQVFSLAHSAETPTSKREKSSSHKHSDKSSRASEKNSKSHSKKKQKTMVLSEVPGKNTLIVLSRNAEGKTVKPGEGKSLPRILQGKGVPHKKPGVVHVDTGTVRTVAPVSNVGVAAPHSVKVTKMISLVSNNVGVASSQTIKGTTGIGSKEPRSSGIVPGVTVTKPQDLSKPDGSFNVPLNLVASVSKESPSVPRVVPVGSQGVASSAPRVVLSTVPQGVASGSHQKVLFCVSQDGKRTPVQVSILPPTPPNDPVLVAPLAQVTAKQHLPAAQPPTIPQNVPLQQQLRTFTPTSLAIQQQPRAPAPMNLHAPSSSVQQNVRVRTLNPQNMSAQVVLRPSASNPNVQIAYFSSPTSQILTRPHVTVERPVASVSPLRKPETAPPKTLAEKPLKLKTTATPILESKDSVNLPSASGDAPALVGKTPDSQNNKDAAEQGAIDDEEDEVVIVDEEEEAPVVSDVQDREMGSTTDTQDEVQEALSPLRKKTGSSPSSSILKIKCEKIDAVVRINKSDDDLYRAAAEQGCFFNVVDKASRLGVCPCGRENAYDAMIACDNTQCETEWYHFTCVGVTKVPKDDWYCPFCTKAAAAAQQKEERRMERRRRKKNEEEGMRRKKKEEEGTRRKRKNVLEEEGLCPCGQPNSWDRMIACDGRECSVEWYHFKCVDVRSAPDQEWLCILCRDQEREPKSSPYVRRKRNYKPIEYSIYADQPDTESDEEGQSRARADKEWGSGSSEGSSSSKSSSDDDDEGEQRRKRRRSGPRKTRDIQRRISYKDGDTDEESSSSDDDDELGDSGSSRRSPRERHPKIDLDFEDGSQFDDDFNVDVREERRKPRPGPRKRRRTGSIDDEDGAVLNRSKSKTPSAGGKLVQKRNAEDTKDDLSKDITLSKSDSSSGVDGRFLIQECSSCRHEFVSISSSKDDSEHANPKAVICPMCAKKKKTSQGTDSSSSEAQSSAQEQTTKDKIASEDSVTANSSSSQDEASKTHSQGTLEQADETATSDVTSPSGLDSSDGLGGRSKRFHEIVACKVCGMGYRTRVSLLIHMKDKHPGHLANFECVPCDKLFISQDECRQHLGSCHHS